MADEWMPFEEEELGLINELGLFSQDLQEKSAFQSEFNVFFSIFAKTCIRACSYADCF